MSIKTDLTKLVASELNLAIDEKSLRKFVTLWWKNPRKKLKGGLRLTKEGFESLDRAGIAYHKILLNSPIGTTNQMVIWLDKLIDCPWYLTDGGKHIFIFGDKIAVQLILFSGNVDKFINAKAENLRLVDKTQ